MKHILYMLFAVLAFASCQDDDDELIPEPTPVIRAVLVYMAADNNLDSGGNLMSDLREMMEGSESLGDDNFLVAYIDRRGNERPYLLQIAHGDTLRLKTFDREANSASADTLRSVMRWMVGETLAESYGLVLWGHAEGWIIRNEVDASRKAFGLDATSDNAWMDIPDLAYALEGLPKLLFIFADCCCFQCAESAYELRHAADYIIASPAEIPADGAPYQTLVPAMFDKTDTFYSTMAEAYARQRCAGYHLPLSVVDTEAMDRLATATRTALAQLPAEDRWPDCDSIVYYYDHNLFDMRHFMRRKLSADAFAQWEPALNEAVIWRKWGGEWMTNYHVNFYEFEFSEANYGGISMFVPQQNSARLNRTISRMQWYQAAGLNRIGW